MTIINIRGTGGSGKSTVVRKVMAAYSGCVEEFTDGRKQPLYYECYNHSLPKLLRVIGHYNTPCGGADTIKTPEQVFDLARAGAALGQDVLFEGIISQDDVTRTVVLNRDFPVTVVYLDTPIQVCLDSIKERRDARANAKPLNPKNTTDRMKRCGYSRDRLKDAGLKCYTLSRDEALVFCLKELGL